MSSPFFIPKAKFVNSEVELTILAYHAMGQISKIDNLSTDDCLKIAKLLKCDFYYESSVYSPTGEFQRDFQA